MSVRKSHSGYNRLLMALPSNPFQTVWQWLPAPLQNRYYLTLVVFFFIMIFLDRHGIWTQWKLHRAEQRLETDKSFYEQKIKSVDLKIQNAIEKYSITYKIDIVFERKFYEVTEL